MSKRNIDIINEIYFRKFSKTLIITTLRNLAEIGGEIRALIKKALHLEKFPTRDSRE